MRQVIALSVALCVALIASYITATAPPPGRDTSELVEVYAGTTDDLQKLVWTGERATVTLEPRSDDSGQHLWVTLAEHKVIAPPEPVDDVDDATDTDATDTDAPVEPAPEPEPVIETFTRSFLGGAKADNLWERFGPFHAVRRLELGADSELDPGFDEPHATIVVQLRSGSRTLVVGDTTPGKRTRYLQADDTLFLVATSELAGLASGNSALMERRLHDLEIDTITEVLVSQDGVSRSFTLHHKDDSEARYWSDSTTPDVKAETEGAYVDGLLRLTVAAYVPEADVPATLTPAVTIVLANDTRIELLAGPGDEPELYVRSAFNRSVVKLPQARAQDLVDEAQRILNPAE